VDVFVPGCPPRPEGIIRGVAVLLDALKKGKHPEPVSDNYPDFNPEAVTAMREEKSQ
jgi:NADH:ubiquinone oxidoreductase subunit B-like Fe-S oxidoreductase